MFASSVIYCFCFSHLIRFCFYSRYIFTSLFCCCVITLNVFNGFCDCITDNGRFRSGALEHAHCCCISNAKLYIREWIELNTEHRFIVKTKKVRTLYKKYYPHRVGSSGSCVVHFVAFFRFISRNYKNYINKRKNTKSDR